MRARFFPFLLAGLLAAGAAGAQTVKDSEAPKPAADKTEQDTKPAPLAAPKAAPGRKRRGPIRLYRKRPPTVDRPAPAEEEAAAKGDKPSKPAVRIDDLDKVDPSSLGTLGVEDGGFATDMWRGSERELVQTLLPRLPVATPSRTARELMRRLLLTAAEAPPGDGTGPSLLALRAEKLAEAGFLAEVNELILLAPYEHRDAMLARVQLEALLLGGDHSSACRIAGRMARLVDDSFWLKASGFCFALREDRNQVELIEQLLRDGDEDDPAYFQLLGVVAKTQAAKTQTLPRPQPLHLAMLRVSGQAVPDDAAMNATPSVLRHIMAAANVSDRLRLDAAVRAERVGALPTVELRRLLETFPFDAETRADPDKLIQQTGGARAEAMLYQLLRDEPDEIRIARTLERAWLYGREQRHTLSYYRVFIPFLGRLEAKPGLSFLAPGAARAYLATGDVGRARGWFDLLRGLRDQESQLEARRLAPLLMIAGALDAGIDESGRLTEWWWGEAANGGAERYRRAAFLFALADAIGIETPEAIWRELIVSPHHANRLEVLVPLRRRLGLAAREGRLGETVLLALVALGGSDIDRLGAASLAEVAGALRAVGLTADARALCLEILLRLNY